MDSDLESVFRYRLAVNHLSGDRLPLAEIATAARSGLQDGSPWSGLLSLNARVEGISGESWRDPLLAQVFGPRGAIYLVPRSDIAVFTLGVFPVDERHADVVREHTAAVHALLDGEPMSQRDIVRYLPELGGTRPLRWAGTTGTLLVVWDTVDTVVAPAPAPLMDATDARCELARRFFRYLGPASVEDLAWWLDTTKRAATQLVEELEPELQKVSADTPLRFITADTADLFADPPEPRPLLLLPPDDLVVNRRTTRPDVEPVVAGRLWPKAPPPGAVIASGEVVGTWRRQGRHVTIHPWITMTPEQLRLASDLAEAFPLRGTDQPFVTVEHV